MVEVKWSLVALLAGVMVIAYLLARSYDPNRPDGRLLARCLVGLALLVGWNALMPGLHLGVNPLSTLVAGGLGAPGMALLAFARLLTP